VRNKPKIETKIVHSESKDAWNIVSKTLASKFKIARIPYFAADNNEIITTMNKAEALDHAKFINFCFNNPDKVEY
jgi:hypothetical protein